MGLLNSALQIGRSAILSYQGALQAVGNNVSNAGSADYTRLAPQLDPIPGSVIADGLQPGGGVAITDIQRYLDEALEGRVRLAVGAQESSSARQSALAEVESFLDDTSGASASSRLTDFYGAMNEVQNEPEDTAMRDLAVSSGAQLAESLKALRGRFATLGVDLDKQVGEAVVQADNLAEEIARLNGRIASSEAGRQGKANALRDQRDALLRKLSELLDVTVREQPDGSINVYVGSEALVQGASSRGLTAVTQSDGEFQRTSVRFADTDQQVEVRGGRLAGLIDARDEHALGEVAKVDQLASAIIDEVNRLHADGQGLEGFRSVTGSYDVLSPDAALDTAAAGLPDPPQSGSFYITVADDATGTPVAYRIEVDLGGEGGGTTLQSLVEDVNAQVEGVSASVTSDNRLSLEADSGFSFTFGHDGQEAREDTSHVLAALGVNTFFTGTDARNIAVNEALESRPSLLAAASVNLAGDGSNAARIAALDAAPSARLSEVSISAFYTGIASAVAVNASAANADMETAGAVLASLQAQKESISGVNLDEEAISLLKYQRAFQGAARFVSVVDRLISELVSIIR